MRALISSPDLTRQLDANSRAKDFLRFLTTVAARNGNVVEAIQSARARNSSIVEAFEKAAISPGTTSDGSFAGPLAPLRAYGQAFLDLIRPRSIVGRMQSAFVNAPVNTAIPRQVGGATAGWVGEGQIAGFSRLSLDTVELPATKLQGLVAISTELAKFSSPAAERVIENDLGATVISMVDTAFLDPSAAATGASPASITYGAPVVAASGATVAAFRADVRELVRQMTLAGAVFAAPFWVMSQQMLINLSLADSALVQNGRIGEIPVLTSTLDVMSDGSSPDSGRIFLLDAAQVLYADEGLEVETAKHATVQLADVADSPEVATTVQISLWQRNLLGLKATRYVNFQARSAGAAGLITGCTYHG